MIPDQEKFINANESFFANCKPTEVTETCWLKASRKNGSSPAARELSGKWLVFVPVEKVDEAWVVIKQATEEGKLGNWSKVATMRRNPNALDPRKKVIYVYTYDSEDRADVNRVRQTLRELGFIEKIPYKTDEATMAGRHRKGDHRVSKYFE